MTAGSLNIKAEGLHFFVCVCTSRLVVTASDLSLSLLHADPLGYFPLNHYHSSNVIVMMTGAHLLTFGY